MNELLAILEKPYEKKFIDNSYYFPVIKKDQKYQTFCGT